MRLEGKFELLLIIIFVTFSWWLMNKSFGYDPLRHQMWIARHEVGDFGLHLGLIRSFSLGDNFPPQSPFFPGRPLPYHYYFDLIVGLLERAGVRIDIALNGVSIVAFSILLFFIYKLPQLLFNKSKFIGLLSVLLFIFHSNLTFIDFFRNRTFSLSLLKDLWYTPDYIHKGPFDGSIISIFFTLNVYLNQRHLILGLAVSLAIFYVFLHAIFKRKPLSIKTIVLLGMILGVLSGIHSLIFFSTVVVLLFLFIAFRKVNWILPFFIPVSVFAFPHTWDILHQDTSVLTNHIFNPGFLSEKPFTLPGFIRYWFMNLGLAFFLIPLGVFIAKPRQRVVFLGFFILFAIANIFQLSFRIDHNHSLVNYFVIVANFYVAYVLYVMWRKNNILKIVVVILTFLLTFSGVIDLMAVKNDFRYSVVDAPANRFMQWVKDNTDKHAIFLSRQEIIDPVVLAGRRNYFGATYYLSVMGYDYSKRESFAKSFFEAAREETLLQMRKENISYIVLSIKLVTDFNYNVNRGFFNKKLQKVYSDENVDVYRL